MGESALPAALPATRRRRLAGDALVVVGVVLAWVLAAGFLAFSIDPLAQALRRKAGVGRGGSITLAMVVIGLVFFLIGLIVVPAVVDGTNGLLDAAPDYAEQLEESGFIQSIGAEDQVETSEDATQQVANFFSGVSSILGAIGAFASGAFAGFMIFVLTIYFMVYGRDLRRSIARHLGPGREQRFLDTTKRIYDMTRGYWYGKFIIAVIAGIFVYVPMVLLDIPYAAPLALFVAITDLIPNIGATIGAIPVVGVALFESWWKGLIMLVVIVIYQQLENSVITPKSSRRRSTCTPSSPSW
jgi:predicted PurR-regulated permease PerM